LPGWYEGVPLWSYLIDHPELIPDKIVLNEFYIKTQDGMEIKLFRPMIVHDPKNEKE